MSICFCFVLDGTLRIPPHIAYIVCSCSILESSILRQDGEGPPNPSKTSAFLFVFVVFLVLLSCVVVFHFLSTSLQSMFDVSWSSVFMSFAVVFWCGISHKNPENLRVDSKAQTSNLALNLYTFGFCFCGPSERGVCVRATCSELLLSEVAKKGQDGPHLGTWMGPKHYKTKHMANLDGTTSDSGWDLDGPRIGPRRGRVWMAPPRDSNRLLGLSDTCIIFLEKMASWNCNPKLNGRQVKFKPRPALGIKSGPVQCLSF